MCQLILRINNILLLDIIICNYSKNSQCNEWYNIPSEQNGWLKLSKFIEKVILF